MDAQYHGQQQNILFPEPQETDAMALLKDWANARARRNEISEVETQVVQAIALAPSARQVTSADHQQQPPSSRQQTTGSMRPVRLQAENETSTASRQTLHIDEYKNKLASSRQQFRQQEQEWQAVLKRFDTGNLSKEEIHRAYVSLIATTRLETDPAVETVQTPLPQASVTIPYRCPDGVVTKTCLAKAIDYCQHFTENTCPSAIRVQPFILSMLILQGCSSYQMGDTIIPIEPDESLGPDIIHCIL